VRVSSISPTAGSRNTTVQVTITGTSLGGASSVTMSGNGVTCTGVTVNVGGTSVGANCTIAANGAGSGVRNVTVATPAGTALSAATFTVN
jgi:2-polyprenyl-6-methoxyphenol hydroxylase-like FAD-dependent oxidoreductase